MRGGIAACPVPSTESHRPMKISLSSAGLAAICLSAAFGQSSTLLAQSGARIETPTTLPIADFSAIDRNAPAPGIRAGTESWNVVLQGRPFDLAELARAHREGVGNDEAKRILNRLDRAAIEWHRPVHEVVGRFGGTVIYDHWIVDAVTVEVPREALAVLQALPQVQELQPDSYRAPGAVPASLPSTLPNDTSTDRNHHNAAAVHAGGNRAFDQWVAVLDTGFDMNDTSETGCFEARAHPTFYENGVVTCLVRTPGSTLPPTPFPFPTPRTGIAESRMQFITQIGQQPSELEDVHGTFVAGIAAGQTWGNTANSAPGHAPDALMAGYALAVLPGGLTIVSRQVAAFQRLTADALFFPIRVANLSYETGSVALSIEVAAMDEAAKVADLLIVAETGNGGPTPLSGSAVASAYNGLIVGAVEPFDRQRATFSPITLPGDPMREYPDLVADGVNVWGPLANSKQDAIASGTSFAAPQVAGAGALFFQRQPNASALEARAAILASTEDLRGSNGGSTAGVGAGYLRDDRMDQIAQGTGLLGTGTVDVPNPAATFTMQLVAGRRYTLAAAWNRQNTAGLSVADLRINVFNGLAAIASEASSGESRLAVRFVSTFSGPATIEVRSAGFESGQNSTEFAIAGIETSPTLIPGSLVEFGASCGPNRMIIDRPAMTGDTHFVFPEFSVAGPNPVTLLVGGSNTTSAFGPLPIALGPTSCNLLVSAEVLVPISGTAATPVAVPNNTALLGTQIFEQLAILDPALQTGFPFFVTQGVRLEIGGRP